MYGKILVITVCLFLYLYYLGAYYGFIVIFCTLLAPAQGLQMTISF